MIEVGSHVAVRVTDGGRAGAREQTTVTSGGPSGASGVGTGSWRHPGWLTAATLAGFGTVQMIVNATSLIDDRRDLGQPVVPWQPWVWEATSLAAWLALLPLILWLTRRIARHVSSVFPRAALHLAATILVSATHSAAMWGLRTLAYFMVGAQYRVPSPLGAELIYEYRKDIVTYAMVVLAYLLFERLVRVPTLVEPGPAVAKRIEVRDGHRAFWLNAEEIEWVAAAGNYVELHGAFGTHLARRTLADMYGELGAHGFEQIHRSRLVQRAMIAKIETRQSGDFNITLRSGTIIIGSRRYRGNL